MPYHHGNLRAALLAKAAEAIEEDGVARLSLRDVARRAGVSHAAPAHHFTDKAGLLTALATDAMHRFRRALSDAANDAGGSARGRLRAMGMTYVLFAAEHPALFRLITRRELIRADDPEYSTASRDTFDMVQDAVIAAQREGWGQNMDPVSLVITAWSTAHGLATLWLDGVLEERTGPLDLEAATAHVLEVMTGG